MEEIKSNNTSNQRRQKIVVGGVGGIAGVLILAGAFAAASLIKNKVNKKKPDIINLEGPPSPLQKTSISDNEEGSEGLRSLLQTSSPSVESHDSSSSSRSIEHDASKVSSAEIDCHLEIKKVETIVVEEQISIIQVNVEEQISTCEGKRIESGNSHALDVIDMVKTSNHSPNNSSSSEEVGSKVLCSVLQTSSASVESHRSFEHEASKAISTLVNHLKSETGGTMIMEETSATTDTVEENVSIFEDHKNESENSKDENLCTDVIDMIKDGIIPESTNEIPSLDIDKDLLTYNIEEEDHSDSRATIFTIKEGDLPEITHVSDEVFEENLSVTLKEVEEYDAEDDKTASETKGSDGTHDHFIGSNSDEVCPVKVTPVQNDDPSETETTEACIKDEIFTCGGIPSLGIDEGVPIDDSINFDLGSTIAEGDQHVNDDFFEKIQSVPLKEVEYAGEGEELERETEVSEGTHDSSIESNSEVVWPTELIEEELSLLKDSEHIQILRKKNDNETSAEAQFEGGYNNLSSLSMDRETGFKLISSPFLISSRPEFWLWSLLAVALLCLFFGNHLPIIYHPSDSQL